MSNLKTYRGYRDLAAARIKEIQTLAKTVEAGTGDISSFKARLTSLETQLTLFEKYHNRILEIVVNAESESFDNDEAKRLEVDSAYFYILKIKEQFDDQLYPRQTPVVQQAQTQSTSRLPELPVPYFDGNINNWQTFIDLFNSIIHSSTSLSNVQKFQHLKSNLAPEPKAIIGTLPITDDNYTIAYDALVARYQNRRLLATNAWNCIKELKKIESESSKELRHILNVFSENLQILENLRLPVSTWDFLLLDTMTSKLNDNLIKGFELHNKSKNRSTGFIPSFESLKEFLENQCTALESVAYLTASNEECSFEQKHKRFSSSFNKNKGNNYPKKQSLVANTNTNTNRNLQCPMCTSNHLLYMCPAFKEKTPRERYNFVKQKNLCLNCMKPSHLTNSCPSTFRCKFCQYNHNSLLHYVSTKSNAIVDNNNLPGTSSEQNCQFQTLSNPTVSNNFASSESTVLLSTAQVNVLDMWNNVQSVRCLLDTGSQANFITEKCLKKLGLPPLKSSITISGLGQNSSKVVGEVTCTLRPQEGPEITVDFLVLNTICSKMPTNYFSIKNWSHVTNLALADPLVNQPTEVEVLLGADIFPLILKEGRIEGQPGQPFALNTIFGWILMGKVEHLNPTVHSFFVSKESKLEQTLKQFWEMEEMPSSKPTCSMDDKRAEEIFCDTTFRDESGKYVVTLPFKTDNPSFGFDIRSFALRRFFALERRLIKNDEMYKEYSAFMKDYLESGHMSLAQDNGITSQFVYYLPHHCVQKPESQTTKLRVVFDASFSPNSLIPSLNDTLLVGPKLQQDIVDILLRFRLHSVVFTADLKQMYRNIWVHPSQRDYQRILWRFSPNEPIQDYILNTVTFGVTSSPFLALRVIKQLADDEETKFPLAASVLRTDLFVDDCVSGCNSVKQALKIQSQLIEICKMGGFDLRKWSSNRTELLSHLPESMLSTQPQSFNLDTEMAALKILGLQWYPNVDCFSYKVEVLDRPCTKRNLLSDLARIYDPLGFLAPLTFFLKYLMQYLWILGLNWNDLVPEEVQKKWTQLKSELHLLSSLQIPRRIVTTNFLQCSLHGFCDSSEKGYACVVYFRVVNLDSSIQTFLVCGKSKVSPLKRVSLPRLELCAAVLLSDMIEFLLKIYDNLITFRDVFAWSDSMTALNWIKSPSYRWTTFISNRVSHIQERVSPASWRYVPTHCNPSDHASRGLLPFDLLNCSQWWAGPSWLVQSEENWPKNILDNLSSDCLKEERKVTLLVTEESNFVNNLLTKYSSLIQIKRIICYCLRFIHNFFCKDKEKRICGHVTLLEYHKATLVLVRYVQQEVFSDEISKLKKNELLPKTFRRLSPFIDSDSILRVGGRLHNSSLSYSQMHPMLLPSKHRLTLLIIESVHKMYLHPGLQSLHYLLSQQFWILSPKRSIKSVIAKCNKCFRTNPKPLEPIMGNLPSCRINEVKPFSISGVDMAGPYFITMSKGRGSKSLKAYVCLFICMATKALHLELVSDLSTDAFLAALRRFVGRRGRCNEILSDQGTNFVGANRELKRVMEIMEEVTAAEAIRWTFNPPSSPHFGGLWESNVKSVKTHLTKVIGEQILTFEELYTVLVQVESVLNSRPLCPSSSDTNDLLPLTPGHFLALEPLNAVPSEDLSNIKLNRLDRWQLLQRMVRDFWRRWSSEYLSTLQQRNKWNKNTPNLAVDTLVVIKDENSPPLRWRLARVVKLHPGSDGVCRVATLRTSQGLFQRPIVKLCPLPSQ